MNSLINGNYDKQVNPHRKSTLHVAKCSGEFNSSVAL